MKKIFSVLLILILLLSTLIIPANGLTVTQSSIDKVVQWAIDTANDDTHGYSQAYDRRWGTPDYDCASFVICAYRSVGFKLSNAAHCGNIKDEFMKEGFQWIPNTQIDMSTSAQLKPGDVLLRISGHTEIYIGDNKQCGAHDDYDGNVRGDTYGNEVCPYTYSNRSNWSGVLRYPVDKPLDIGTDFYATIVNNSTGKAVTNTSDENCENRNAITEPLTNSSNQIWKFERRENGSYKISSVFNGLALDVTGAGTTSGTNVGVYFSSDKPAQQWNVFGESGKYRLKPLCNNLALDVNKTTNNLQMGTDNNSASQYFSINIVSAPQSTYVECKAGTSLTQTALWWNMTLYTDSYDLLIWESGKTEAEPYATLTGITDTFAQIELPKGEYLAVVYSNNVVGSTKSINTVEFTVEKDPNYSLGDVDLDGEISVLDAAAIQLHLVETKPLSFGQADYADTDKDGEISVLDALRIQMFLVNKVPKL